MRSAEQITRTPREYHDFREAERARIGAQLRRELAAARAAGAEWYRWIEAGMPKLTTEEYERRVGPGARGARRGRRQRST